MRMIAVAWLILICAPAFAASSGSAGGVSVDLALGYGTAKIQNPDDSYANYRILSLNGKGKIPLWEGKNYGLALTGGLRYLDLENNANNSAQQEVANMIGPGVGFQARAFKFVFGYEYYMMLARHYTVGSISESTNYQMAMMNMYAGISIPFRQLAISVLYSQSSGTVPKSETNLSKDAPYSDQIYWIQLSYSTGLSLGEFLKFLF